MMNQPGTPSMKPDAGLGGDDVADAQRAGVDEDAGDRETLRDLVGDHLGARAHPAEQRVRRVRRPAAEERRVDVQRAHGEEPQHADAEVGDLQRERLATERHVPTDGDDGDGEEPGDDGDERRDRVDRLLDHRGRDVLLEEHLHAVDERLQDAERSDTVGPEARLHARDDATLGPDEHGGRQQEVGEDDPDGGHDHPQAAGSCAHRHGDTGERDAHAPVVVRQRGHERRRSRCAVGR
jgi:hypothetical protein